jgi:hypothetical protein
MLGAHLPDTCIEATLQRDAPSAYNLQTKVLQEVHGTMATAHPGRTKIREGQRTSTGSIAVEEVNQTNTIQTQPPAGPASAVEDRTLNTWRTQPPS